MFIDSLFELLQESVGLPDVTSRTFVLLITTLVLCAAFIYRCLTGEKIQGNVPPHIPSTIPFIGQAFSFGTNPTEFILDAYAKYGPVFSFTMMGKTFTYLVGSEASALFFNSNNSNLNIEEVYSPVLTPITGKGVVFDAPRAVFWEQKKIISTYLTGDNFREHVPIIEEETWNYFKKWDKDGVDDVFKAMSELVTRTHSHCILGHEIRTELDDHFAQLYKDLAGGFSSLAWLMPKWVPFPSFRKRDQAHIQIKKIFNDVIQKRRKVPKPHNDCMQAMINSKYRSGEKLSDDEISGSLIGIMFAGLQTVSTSSSWFCFFLAKDKELQQKVYEEQKAICGDSLAPVNFVQLKEMQLLDRCFKETLRLRPPGSIMMRMCRTPQNVLGYTIPPGHCVCVSLLANHMLPNTWKDCDKFIPDRFLDRDVINSDKFVYSPFGAGRHRCIGEQFAYVEFKTIFSVLIRKYEFNLVNGYFPEMAMSVMNHYPIAPLISYRLRNSQ